MDTQFHLSFLFYLNKLLQRKVEEKVLNPALYEELKSDPRSQQYDILIDLWKFAKAKNFVSMHEAKAIVGLTANDNKSTASRYKYGRTYPVPSLKIHKLKPNELVPGVDIPTRLISCLQEGVTKRCDVFLVDKWLQDLEKDYCKDLVKDTNASLIWLESCNTVASESNKSYSPFTFDFDSLYDSIDPQLAFTALQDAMSTCRELWSDEFKSWLLGLIQLSIDSSTVEYLGRFFRALSGLPTGGSLIVQLANITVFYVLHRVLYSNNRLMKDVVSIKRFIDDGIGIHTMTSRQFDLWKRSVSDGVSVFGLKIKDSDWSTPSEKFGMINFLDINFSFDKDNVLQTDLYVKPTDSRSYLNYSSCHPQYTFSGTVYSQALRLRRIINCNIRLVRRLQELGEDFARCNYPVDMIENILHKVSCMDRCLDGEKDPSIADHGAIMVISTYGRDKQLTDSVRCLQKNCENLNFRFVKKTAPSLKKTFSLMVN